MRSISSAANPAYRHWLRLATQPRALRDAGRTLAEGIHLAQAALAADAAIETLLIRRGAQGAEIDPLIDAVAARGAPAFELAAALFDRLSPVQTSVGLMLELAIPPRQVLPPLEEDAIYLDGIQDPGNAGALLRVAAAAGTRCVLTAPGTTALWAPRTLRAGQGAHFLLRLFEGVAPAEAAAVLRGTWAATVARDADSLWDAALPGAAMGWVFGAEGRGVSAAMLAACGTRVRIPLVGVESLNVAAAAAVCLFERRRRIASRRGS